MSNPSRREVLALLSGLGASALLGGAVGGGGAGADDGAPALPEVFDVAVVGGGIAGAYTAWRLLSGDVARSTVLRPRAGDRAHPGLAVGLFECGNRVGGRLRSVAPPGMPSLRAEMGGMRFPTTHTIVVKLVEHLRLAVTDFPVSGKESLHYLRGRRFRLKEWSTPGTLPYNLTPADRTKSLDDLLVEIVEHYVPEARKLDAREWDRCKPRCRVDSRPLCDHGFWSLVLRAKGGEVCKLIRDAGGYGSFYRNWNAAEMMSWIMADFWGPPKYLTLRDGYDGLPRELARRFADLGGRLLLRHRLRRLARARHDGAPVLRLDFAPPGGKGTRSYQARHVVLALPRRAIESLEPDSLPLDSAQFRADLRSVSPQVAAKAFLGYPRPWWRALGVQAGRSTTDLPLRQCYYLGTEGDQRGADPSNQNSLLMASYHDDVEVGFWEALQDASGAERKSPPGSGAVPEDLRASEALVAEMHRQVKEVHGPESRAPDPYTALYVNWAQTPSGASWHFWNIHTRPMEVIPRMRQPLADANLYVCGEAWSTDQGWVRGALHTAERLLQDKFRLPRPDWLPADEYLGP
jgi:monoamine oxidase